MKNNLLKSASIVTGLSVAERALGFLYRIALSRLIGAEGLGLYQVSLSLFSLFLTIGTGGIPITVSRMIAKHRSERNPEGERSTVTAGLLLSLLLTLPVCLLFGVFGKNATFLFTDDRCLPIFRILLIGLCFSSAYAVFRGYFWGNKQFLLASVLEIAEEIVMVIVGICLLQRVSSASSGANLAAWAVIISYLFSFTASFICFLVNNGKFSSPKQQMKPLFNATLPITSVRASGSLVNSAIAVLLPAMLIRAGWSESQSLQLFGIVTGMALPILFVPSTIIGSISLVLVPELSEDFYMHNFKRLYANISRGLRAALLVSCFLLPLFYAIGEDLGKIAFSNPLAGEIIRKSCPLLIPMSLTMISTGMLNSMGFEKQTFLFYFVGAATMLICILLLPPVCGVYAYVWGLSASFSINAVCNLVFLRKQCPKAQKPRGHVRVEGVFGSLLLILPLSLIGQYFHTLFQVFFGEVVTLFFTAITIAAITLIAYVFMKIIPLPRFTFLKKKTHYEGKKGNRRSPAHPTIFSH